MWQKRRVLEMICQMETLFLIALPLVSNNNDWTLRILHNQLRVILTHTPALPIHNEQNYQELKREREKERGTCTHPKARLRWKEAREKEEEPRRKGMLYRCVVTNSRPNSLSVKNWIRYRTHLRRLLRSSTVAWEREKEREWGGDWGRE